MQKKILFKEFKTKKAKNQKKKAEARNERNKSVKTSAAKLVTKEKRRFFCFFF